MDIVPCVHLPIVTHDHNHIMVAMQV